MQSPSKDDDNEGKSSETNRGLAQQSKPIEEIGEGNEQSPEVKKAKKPRKNKKEEKEKELVKSLLESMAQPNPEEERKREAQQEMLKFLEDQYENTSALIEIEKVKKRMFEFQKTVIASKLTTFKKVQSPKNLKLTKYYRALKD